MRRFIAVDDCGVRINPMIVEGQIHGGLAEGVGIALMELIAFDEQGNCLGGSFMDYLIPTSMEVPDWELGETVTPSPHHPIGAKGVGESPTSARRRRSSTRSSTRCTRPRRATTSTCRARRRACGRRCRGRRRRRNDHGEIAERARRARAAGVAVREATVVRAAARRRARGRATSRSCSRDGTIEGFVGGACAESTVRLQALRALETGEPLLLRILPGRRGRARRVEEAP